MVFDALDKFLFTTGSGITSTSDKTGATITQTANSDAFDFVTGGVGYTQPMYAVVRFNAAQNSTGGNAITLVVQKSTDNLNWFDAFSAQANTITLVNGSPQAGLINIPIETRERYVRLAVVVSGGGTGSQIIILSADLNIGPL